MNSTALAVIQPEELDTMQRAARLLAVSNYFDGKGDNPQAIAMLATKIMAGREMGFGPFASANGIHIIKGKPTIGANLMASAVKGNGKYDYRVREMSNERCSIEFFERVGDKLESLGISTFTKEDATAAETQNMHKFPRNMLFARAMSNGVKWFVPDVFSGNVVYVPEELGAEVDAEGNVIESTYTVTKPIHEEQDFGMGAKADNPFEDTTPFYQREWAKLTGKEYDLVNWVQQLHRKDEPCSDKQYQFLTGVVDSITDKQHGHVLSILCQSDISGSSKPSRMAAKALLRHLQKEVNAVDANGVEIKDDEGKTVKVANPDYRQDMADMVTKLAQEQQQAAA